MNFVDIINNINKVNVSSLHFVSKLLIVTINFDGLLIGFEIDCGVLVTIVPRKYLYENEMKESKSIKLNLDNYAVIKVLGQALVDPLISDIKALKLNLIILSDRVQNL